MVGIDKLKTKIIQKKAKIAVIGLGYVGLPLACLFADAGFSVVGIDLDKQRIKKVNQGLSPIAGKEPGLDDLVKRVVTSGKLNTGDDYAYLKDVDVVLIAVQTPIKKSHQPDYGALKVVLSSLGPVLKDGSLIIVESTLSPGTMQNFVLPILEKYSAKRQGVDFYLGHCPERVMPGKLLMKLRNMPRVVGGRNPQISDVMVALYKHIVVGDLDVTDWITAELVKTTENAYRDVQIAFANEVAIICEKLGGNVWKVRELINKIPERNMLLPGAGVGGHCIPKDPWLLYSSAVEANATPRLINAAREVNDGMPMHVLDMLENAQAEIGRALKESRVLVLGYTYLENSDDTRNSPSALLVKGLQEKGVHVIIHDPYVHAYQGDVYELASDTDAIILMTAHEEYSAIVLPRLAKNMRTKVLIDGRNCFNKEEANSVGFRYKKIGMGD